MFGRSVESKLRKVGASLRKTRDELAVLDEQLPYLDDDADDMATRAVVSDDRSFGPEARRAREHVDALRAERDRLRAKIVQLEIDQDRLLDQLSGSL